MSPEVVEPDPDTFASLARYRQIVSQLSSNDAPSATVPLNGADPAAVATALELAPCLRVPRDIVTVFCSFSLGHRLVPVACRDSHGLMRWPTIDAHLTDDDLRDVADGNQRRDIADSLRIWASVVEQPLGQCNANGWIGGRFVRDELGQAQMLWPILHPAFSSTAFAEPSSLFRALNIAVDAEA
ncbi:MAG: hypothetical protein K2X57_26330 [Xanthobacteraceae bacterium]|nr:hypothetical protein [Xanthobacteraceae bacterium]